jgi:salicylate hydroxylase
VEDAEILGRLFSKLQDKRQILQHLATFEELRQTPCLGRAENGGCSPLVQVLIRKSERWDSGRWWRMMNEKTFKEVWSDDLQQFTYDAAEKFRDW